MKQPTIDEVARRAGVSKSTVSAVLNNKDVVKESTRKTILDIIDELKYRPRESARRRFQSIAGISICFLIKESGNPYYAEALSGIQEVASEAGCFVFTSSSQGDYVLEQSIVQQAMAREFSGLIITPIVDDDSDLTHIYDLKRHHVPFVLLERVRGVQASLVDVDNVAASCGAVRYLIEAGHSHIVHFAGPRYSIHSQERIEGVMRACSESHLKLDPHMIIQTGDSFDHGYCEGLRFFRESRSARPTAVTCYNDLVAIGLIKALDELGLRVPDDVSVIGFDDIEMLKYVRIPLTTVHVPKKEMGKRAAEILLGLLQQRREAPIQKITLEAPLVVRESTRSLKLRQN